MICYKWLKATLWDSTPLPSTPGSIFRHTWSWEVHVISIYFWIKEHETNTLNWHSGSLIRVLRTNLSSGPWGSIELDTVFPEAPTDSGGGELWPCPRHQFFSRVPGNTQLSGALLSPEQLSLWDSSQNLPPSGTAIAIERHGGGEETLGELTLAPGHIKAHHLSGGHTLVIWGTQAFREFEI